MAGIVEKVSAQVVYEFPLEVAKKSSLGHKIPVSTLTIKQFEDFLFNARIRGADDDTPCTIESKRFWDGYSHNDMPYAFSVGVSATMDGMPMMTNTPESKPSMTYVEIVGIIIIIASLVLGIVTLF